MASSAGTRRGPCLSRAGRASSRPAASSGTRHNGGTGPVSPDSSITVWTVTLISRLAAANMMNASGNSASSALSTLVVKPLEPAVVVRGFARRFGRIRGGHGADVAVLDELLEAVGVDLADHPAADEPYSGRRAAHGVTVACGKARSPVTPASARATVSIR